MKGLVVLAVSVVLVGVMAAWTATIETLDDRSHRLRGWRE